MPQSEKDTTTELGQATSISHLDVADHAIDLQAITSNALSIGDVGMSLSASAKHTILKRLNFAGLVSLDNLPATATFMIEKIEALPVAEAFEILKDAIEEFSHDGNIPSQDVNLFERLVASAPADLSNSPSKDLKEDLGKALNSKNSEKGTATSESVSGSASDNTSDIELESDSRSYLVITDWVLQIKLEAALIAYYSPYPEVRSVTEPFDDPAVPCETWRVYVVGLIWTAIGTFINQFFSQRQPSISLSTSVVQIFIYPCGLLLSWIMPKKKIKVWKWEVDLNPGSWTFKEQMLTTIFYAVSGGNSYVSYNIHVQKLDLYYGNKWANFGYQTLLILCTNFMGFGFAGIMRKFAVYPTRAIWPTLLPTLALNKALMSPEKKEVINGWKISRYAFFFTTFGASFLYFWIPNYLFGALSTFNWMTWIAPNNNTLATITGSVSGLGLNPIPSFDWNVLDYNFGMTVPFYSQVNQYVGSLLGFFAILRVYYTNNNWAGYIPINTASLYSNTGKLYSVRSIVNSDTMFDDEKYQKMGPPYYSAANLVLYGAFFALYPFAFIYEVGSNWRPMWQAMTSLGRSLRNWNKSTYEGFTDPHTRMMSRYKEVPDWVFLVVLVISVVLAIVCVTIYPTQTPVWGIFFALGMNFVFLIPLTSITASTGFSFGLNVLVELIVGYALPGNGLALMFIKALGYNIDGQASNYISDQKMGHYIKIPPRAMFRCQMLSLIVHSFIGLAVMNFQMTSIEDYCMPGQPQKFTCPGAKVFYNSSIFWGVIGPGKVFGGIYPVLKYCFLIGSVLAFVCLAVKYYGPKKYLNAFQPTLILGGFLIYAPYNLSYYTGSLYLSLGSMWYLKNYYTSFWEKYNYIFSGAMSAGVAFSGIIIFFAVQYNDKSISWWGNNVMYEGADGAGSYTRLNVTLDAPDGYFGIRKGNYP